MLPRETTIRQLKKLRTETKGTDIGDLTTDDRLNINTPNLQYIGNPTSNLESWDDFSKKDSQLQTIAFKSKLQNKPIIKENKKEVMKNKINNLIGFSDFDKNWKTEDAKKTKRTDVAKDIVKEKRFYDVDELQTEEEVLAQEENAQVEELEERNVELFEYFSEDKEEYEEEYEEEYKEEYEEDDDDEYEEDDDDENNWENRDIEPIYFEEYDKLPEEEDYFEEEDLELMDLEENVQTFESFALKDVTPKKETQPEYTMLGEEKEPKSNPNFGIGAVKDQEIKKIAFFNNYTIDPPTPKERPILNAGQYIDNEFAKGQINRIEGNKVFVESADEPMKIIEINIKDAVKLKKS